MDRLPPQEKRLLPNRRGHRHGGALGLVQATAELPLNSTMLAYLQHRVYRGSLFPDLAFTFKHASPEVAYGSLLPERRRASTPASSRPWKRSYADRLAEQVERLAHHACGARSGTKGPTYSRQAGAKAEARSATRAVAASSSTGHLHADDRGGLQQALLLWWQPIHPSDQHRLDRRWHLDVLQVLARR